MVFTKLSWIFGIGLLTASGIPSENPSLFSQDEKPVEKQETVGTLIQKAYKSSTGAENHKDFSTTIQLCDQTLALDVSDSQKQYLNQLKAWALISRARLYPSNKIDPKSEKSILDSKSIQLAIQDCSEAIKAEPTNWKAYLERARRNQELGETKRAIADLGFAIRKQPGEARTWFNRAELLYSTQQFEVAAADYTEAIKLDSNDIQSLTGRAHCYTRLNQYDLALADYDAVIEKSRASARAFLNRAELHLRTKEFAAAGNDFREALKRDQTLAAAYRGVAWMYATSMKDNYYNPTVADRSVKRAIELDGKETTDNLVILAAAQASAGEYSMARDTMKRVEQDKGLGMDSREKLEFLRNQKWYLAGTGKK